MDVTGRKELKVDGSGRFFLPKGAIDPVLGEDGEPRLPDLWVCPSFEPCLLLLDEAEYRILESRVREIDYGDPNQQRAQRIFFGLTSRVRPDKSGRITLSEEQRQQAKIAEGLFWQGMGRHVELWDPEKARELGILQPPGAPLDPQDLQTLAAAFRPKPAVSS